MTDLNSYQEERAREMGATRFLVSGEDIVQKVISAIGAPSAFEALRKRTTECKLLVDPRAR